MEKAKWIKCRGDAHLPDVAGMMDHCGICMPWWEYYPVCPNCNMRLNGRGFCTMCNETFDLERKK